MDKNKVSTGILWRPVVVVTALLFVFYPVLTRLVGHWWVDENYSHGLLVPFVIGFIVWARLPDLKQLDRTPSLWIGGSVIIVGLLGLLAGTLGAELFIQRVAFLIVCAGILIYFFGQILLRAVAIPFLLFALAIPIPQIIFNKLAFPLQIYASQLAVWGIRIFGVPTVRKGNVIEILPEGSVSIIALEVVEACSGIRSLMTLVTLAVILVYFTRGTEFVKPGKWRAFLGNRDVIRGAILMVSAIPIAVLTNAGRVTATGVLTYEWGVRATESFIHEVSGWLVYLVALVLLLLVNLLLKRLLGTSEGNSDRDQGISNEAAGTANFGYWMLVAALIVGGVLINWFETRGEVQIERRPLSAFASSLGEWKQKGDSIKFSEETESVLKTTDYTMRDYEKDGRRANVYVGYYASQKTGATYHSPQNCLPGSGWEMRSPQVITIPSKNGPFEANRYIIQNGEHTEVMIYWYQGRGRINASEYRDKIYTVLDSVLRRRSDGSMVRIMTAAGEDQEAASKAATELAGEVFEALAPHIPR